MAAPPPQTFPYDYLFKVLIIGDASVGKVSSRVLLLYFDVLMRAAYLRKGEFFFIVGRGQQIHRARCCCVSRMTLLTSIFNLQLELISRYVCVICRSGYVSLIITECFVSTLSNALCSQHLGKAFGRGREASQAHNLGHGGSGAFSYADEQLLPRCARRRSRV